MTNKENNKTNNYQEAFELVKFTKGMPFTIDFKRMLMKSQTSRFNHAYQDLIG